jgi:hypothetical protein
MISSREMWRAPHFGELPSIRYKDVVPPRGGWMQIDMRRTAAVLVGLAMVAGIAYFLVSDSGADPPGPPPGNGSAESPTPTESPSPTTEPPPELTNTGIDFEAIWRSIEEFRVYLAHNPDPSLLRQIYHPDCECYDREIRLLMRYQQRGWRFEGPATETLRVELVDRPATHVAVLRIVDRHDSQTVVNRNGDVIKTDVGWPRTQWAFTLNRNDNGRWRVRAIILEERA